MFELTGLRLGPEGKRRRFSKIHDTPKKITYELWKAVYDWATDDARGANKYTFANPGRQGGDDGSGPVGTNQHPVTTISWRDALVWCNAYSEAAGKSPAYRDSSNAILRSSSVDVENRIDAGKISDNNGFRLPTESAWLSAARSGSWTYTYAGSNNINDVAVYSGNSGNSTAEVKSKAPNDFGLYDMSGNVLEWCYDRELGYYPIFRGGSWGSSAAGCKIPMGGGGLAGGNYTDPFAMSKDRGFRVVRP